MFLSPQNKWNHFFFQKLVWSPSYAREGEQFQVLMLIQLLAVLLSCENWFTVVTTQGARPGGSRPGKQAVVFWGWLQSLASVDSTSQACYFIAIVCVRRLCKWSMQTRLRYGMDYCNDYGFILHVLVFPSYSKLWDSAVSNYSWLNQD